MGGLEEKSMQGDSQSGSGVDYAIKLLQAAQLMLKKHNKSCLCNLKTSLQEEMGLRYSLSRMYSHAKFRLS